jgi:biotin carboxyl carrier protein
MSSSISGKIGSIQLEWITFSSSRKGSGKVKVDGRVYDVSWTMDSFGLWLELSHGVFGFDCQPVSDDEGRVTYQLRSRQGIENHPSLSFVRGSDGAGAGELVQKKKARRIKSQMPGKIIRLNVKAGDRVEKDEVLLVMEAMKMENPIRASHAGKVSTVTVTEGQAVETGAELLILGD